MLTEYGIVGERWMALTGQCNPALVSVSEGSPYLLHRDVLKPWQFLVGRAADEHFCLSIASAYRSFERQCQIWNGKAQGLRPVLDGDGKAMDVSQLTQEQLLFAMLRWSAIPGCSRHHWGTDVDVYDANAVAADYSVQLTADECEGTGPFTRLHVWLDAQLALPDAVFFRPYAVDRGGIAPERWHLSCAPAAAEYQALLDEARLADWLAQQNIALKELILKHWHDIFHRYILVPLPSP